MTGRRIQISTGARLHFGLLSFSADDGSTSGHHSADRPQFGGAGLMIDGLGVQVSISQAAENLITAPDVVRCRVKTVRDRLQSAYPKIFDFACHLEIKQYIPAHQGFGSGTQLAMAVAQALCCLARRQLLLEDLVHLIERGRRSAIGVHGFFQGGFLVDGGKSSPEELAPLVSRIEFPDEWRFLLVTPPAEVGFSGTQEHEAFSTLPTYPKSLTPRLCELLVMQLLPGIATRNFSRTSASLHEFGNLVGEGFRVAQGGHLASPLMTELAEHLKAIGVPGYSQTSWGPTLCILCDSERMAQELEQDLIGSSKWKTCQFRRVSPRNGGATVEEYIA